MRKIISLNLLLVSCLLGFAGSSRQNSEAIGVAGNFSKDKVHAWALVLFDIERSPEERALMLERVGFKKAGFVVSNDKILAQLGAHIAAYRAQEIDLISVWWQSSSADVMGEAKTRKILSTLDEQQISPDIWFSLEKGLVAGIPEDQRVDRAVGIIRPLAIEARRRGVRLALYNHLDWFGETDNQIAIIKKLRSEGNMDHVGIVYNMHHGHDRIDNFGAVLAKMQSYLFALNLNGMRVEGPKIIPIGEGDREQAMIQAVIDSGFNGSVGILHHFANQDAEPVYLKNLAGLKKILELLGYKKVAATY